MAMKSSKILFIFFISMSVATSLSAMPTLYESRVNIKKGNGRFLAERVQVVKMCDVNPKLCRAKGRPGPNCCNKQCVNLMTDKLNCGKCGKKCGYSELCCQGACVNPSSDERHCGRCNNRCSNGGSCEHGLCNYA